MKKNNYIKESSGPKKRRNCLLPCFSDQKRQAYQSWQFPRCLTGPSGLRTGASPAVRSFPDTAVLREGVPFVLRKWVSLINLRDNGLYIGNPIYLGQQLFYYYLSPHHVLKFDMEDLFYYSSHKIMCRGNHYFVADYGMQQTLTSRYGIKSYGVTGVDYCFVNGDPTDFRRENLQIHNIYHGVRKTVAKTDSTFILSAFISVVIILWGATLLISKQPLPITRPSIFCIAKESPVILPPTMWKPSLPAVMPRSILRSTLHRES